MDRDGTEGERPPPGDAAPAEDEEAASGSGTTPGAGPSPDRTTFAVGRVDRKTAEIRLPGENASPIPGPWAVRAIVRPRGTRDPDPRRKPPRLRVEP